MLHSEVFHPGIVSYTTSTFSKSSRLAIQYNMRVNNSKQINKVVYTRELNTKM